MVQRSPAFPNVFPSPRLHFLTKGFWLTNQNKQFISTRKFLDGLSQIVNATAVFTPREDLLTILIGELCLQSHSGTDALRVSPLFHDWSSTRPSDSLFGALLIDENYDFSGLSSFFCSINEDVKIWLNRFVKALEAKTPTRFVCLVPSQLFAFPMLEIAKFASGAPLFKTQDSCLAHAGNSMSLVLIANKESLAIDPINWESFSNKLRTLSEDWNTECLSIPPLTDMLFRERRTLQHPPRALSKNKWSFALSSPSLLSFFDSHCRAQPRSSSFGIPESDAFFIDQINRHPRLLAILGILPNHLRLLLKRTDHVDSETVLTELSRSLFFAGFRIWRKRQVLIKRFWSEISPHDIARRTNGKSDKKFISYCKNPLHFMPKFTDLSKQRPTRCFCSIVQNEKVNDIVFRDIRSFFTKFPSLHVPKNENLSSSKYPTLNLNLFTTRTDDIRNNHNRGRKKKK